MQEYTGPRTVHAYILRAFERILARYNDLFLSISCYLPEMTKETLNIKYIRV